MRHTPLARSLYWSERCGVDAYLKLENLQEAGSFKLRGAANKLLSLAGRASSWGTIEQAEEDSGDAGGGPMREAPTGCAKTPGVITVSSGNHGRAVAYVAGKVGLRAVICLSRRVPAVKVEAIRRLGAEVVVYGESYDEAEAHSYDLEKEQGLARVPPFDDPLIMAGGIGLDNRYTFAAVQRYVDETALVSEEEIEGAMALALEQEHLVVEGGGAVGLAALLAGKVRPAGPTAVVISGGNIDIAVVLEVVARRSIH